MQPFYFRWVWQLQSTPEAFWPFIADTDRVNQDSGLSPVKNLLAPGQRLANAVRQLRVQMYGVALEYEEQPFEWVRPVRYGVQRRFRPALLNPLREFRMLAELQPRPEGGSTLTYQIWATPANALVAFALPLQIGVLTRWQMARAIRRYDRLAASRGTRLDLPARVELAPGGTDRLQAASRQLLAQGLDADLVARLVHLVQHADNTMVMRLRPYALADVWNRPRREVLSLCLHATRAGLLNFEWDLVCPHCRNAALQVDSLSGLSNRTRAHCDTCNVDFTADLEHSVELTFHPNPAIRPVTRAAFCIAGPQVTPHIIIQQLLQPGERRTLTAALEPGRYRRRALELPGAQPLTVGADGEAEATLPVGDGREVRIAPRTTLTLHNPEPREHLFILERTAWSDQAALAADVTALQVFRDLFANEAVRPGEHISVGSLTILFTDLRGSTRLYREIGDAAAFGLVMGHFDVLREAIALEEGGIVKNLGDAVLAVFRRPASAVRALLRAQRALSTPPAPARPLLLKVGIHHGPCIAVNFNDRLDYFGSTVNAASRLVELSTGQDVVLSDTVRQDPEVSALLANPANGLHLEPGTITLKGFDAEVFNIWRVRVKA